MENGDLVKIFAMQSRKWVRLEQDGRMFADVDAQSPGLASCFQFRHTSTVSDEIWSIWVPWSQGGPDPWFNVWIDGDNRLSGLATMVAAANYATFRIAPTGAELVGPAGLPKFVPNCRSRTVPFPWAEGESGAGVTLLNIWRGAHTNRFVSAIAEEGGLLVTDRDEAGEEESFLLVS